MSGRQFNRRPNESPAIDSQKSKIGMFSGRRYGGLPQGTGRRGRRRKAMVGGR